MSLSPELVRSAAVAATLGVAAVIATQFGLPLALIVLAGGALLLGITLLWGSVQNLTGETPISLEEALTLGAPTAEEEQKRALLRALKDLEYERSVGKISPDDYQELATRYRAEAIALMQQLDLHLAPARERAEKLFRERLSKAGLEIGRASEPHSEQPAESASADVFPEPNSESEPAAQAEAVDAEDQQPEVKS